MEEMKGGRKIGEGIRRMEEEKEKEEMEGEAEARRGGGGGGGARRMDGGGRGKAETSRKVFRSPVTRTQLWCTHVFSRECECTLEEEEEEEGVTFIFSYGRYISWKLGK